MTFIFSIEQVARQFGLSYACCARRAVHRLARYAAATVGITATNANADVDDACSDVDAFA